jgi:hypothetical protein
VRSRFVVLTVVAAVVGAAGLTSGATAQPRDVSFVRIIRVTQAPYQAVKFRVWVKAPVGHDVLLAVKIFDSSGRTVYTPKSGSPTEARYQQPYYSTSLTVKWNKNADDGSRLPRGQSFVALAFATDLGTNQKLFRSSPYRFTLTS